MGQIRQKNCHPVSLLDAVGSQKMSNAIRRIFDLGIGAGGIVENRIHQIRVTGGRFIENGK